MPSQRTVFYSQMFNEAVSLNGHIRTVAVINLFGDLVYHNAHKSVGVASAETREQFRRLSSSISMLTFENIKFILMEQDYMKTILINAGETSIMIGMDEKAAWKDVLSVLDYFSDLCLPDHG